MGWLAVPGIVEMTEAQVSAVFNAFGAWSQVKVAA